MKLVFPIIVSPLVSLKEIGQGITIYLHPQALTFLTSLSWGVQKQQKGVFEAAAAVMTKEKHPGSCSRQSRLTSRSLPRKAEGVGGFPSCSLEFTGLTLCLWTRAEGARPPRGHCPIPDWPAGCFCPRPHKITESRLKGPCSNLSIRLHFEFYFGHRLPMSLF